jgi:hypothetical protein
MAIRLTALVGPYGPRSNRRVAAPEDGAGVAPARESGAETRRPSTLGRSCDHCREPLTGRKKRSCSDRCRLRHRRAQRQTKTAEVLARLEGNVAKLRHLLGGER